MKLNKYLAILLLTVSTTYLSACAPAIVGGAAAGTYAARDERSVGTIVDDATITTQIKGKYLTDDLVSAVDIHVDTAKGIVTLSGNIPNFEAKRRAMTLAKNTKHVVRIIDKLTIIN